MKHIKILMPIMVLILSSSCKDFLDTEPLTESKEETFYRDQKQATAALAGVYDVLGRTATYGNYMLGMMGLEGDEAYYRTSSTTVGIESNSASASESFVNVNWAAWYEGINRANLLLENIHRTEMDSIERKVIKGEALFLRAYYHFMLVKHWGDVPLMIKSIENPADVYAERTPSTQVYEQIEKDMIEAEGLVKTAMEVGHGGRVNKSAVRGILARVYMHWAGYPLKDESKYQNARDWAYKVMQPDPKDGFQHALNPSYEDVFIKHCTNQYDVKESIWEVEFYGNGASDNGYSETGRVGSNNGVRYTEEDPDYSYSYGYTLIPARTWYSFESPEAYISPDERREWSIANYSLSRSPAIETAVSIQTRLSRSSAKWRRDLETVYPKSKNAGPINFPLLRFSDVLLMFAEAENQIYKYPTEDAINALEMVRRRAYGKDLTPEGVRYILIANAGSGYRSTPTITITGGGGTGAQARVFVNPSSRVITHIKVINQGSGYTSAPTVTISGGSGTGGRGTAYITTRRTSSHLLDRSKYGSYRTFQKFIEDERLRELSFECLRKGDLTRWGKYEENMKRIRQDFLLGDAEVGISASTTSQSGFAYFNNASRKDLLWPIPPFQMALNKGLKTQNYGY